MTSDHGPLGQLQDDHKWSHSQIDVLRDTVDAIGKGDTGLIHQVSAQLREYVEVVRRHVDAEETASFDPVSRYLTQNDLDGLGQEFDVVHDDEVEEGVQAFYEGLAHRVVADEQEIWG